ncbi:conjugal transfer protein [Cereibacter changlensis]|uniref:Conjugal transfer protein n=1 Tax=Cereibacter changlensis TaxID=402884 RepID=A0A4U0YZN5_9RHOB|nr:conjugal transfer pilus assembly protein TraU [Cereibacter changlensis]TKA98392.1 conjugal transfer protein [Cereibacter changlensis]
MKRFASIVALALSLTVFGEEVWAKCNAKFLNPLTDVCWDCIFPISIGAIRVLNKRPDTSNPSLPVCICPGVPPRLGLAIGLWEPARLTDVANEAGCFVNMGFKADLGLFSIGKSSVTSSGGDATGSKWQSHYYYYPLISWLGTVVDGLCLENTIFDIAYISEFDPLWQDPELNNIINPEAILFTNPVAHAACAADCVRSSGGGLPLDKLFWCNGCQGGMYPMTGDSNAHYGGVQASETITAKMIARQHRLGLARTTSSSSSALCTPDIAPIIKKSQYRLQLTRPRSVTSGRYACGPLGSSTQMIDSRREYPYKGESFGWLMWRKRNCCAL